MPAYFDTGFSVREPMWHGEGLVLDEYPTDWADARAKAGLTWEPVERTPFILRPASTFRECPECGVSLGGQHEDSCSESGKVKLEAIVPAAAVIAPEGIFVPVPDHKMIVRSDTELVLGVRSDEYQAIYHSEEGAEKVAAEVGERASLELIIDAVLGADKKVKFETGGSCREGRFVWALCYIDEPYTVPGDDSEHLPFIAFLTHHGEAGGCKAVNTQVRVVCWNTFQMASAEGERTGRQFTFRHVGDVRERVEDARAALAGLRTESHEYAELAADMMKLTANDKHLSAYLSEFLPSPREQGEVVTDRVHENVEKARSMFRHIYTDSITTEAVRGTAWGLVQASTEYLDHARAWRSPDSYLGRSILRAEPAKARALEIARRVCK